MHKASLLPIAVLAFIAMPAAAAFKTDGLDATSHDISYAGPFQEILWTRPIR